MELSTSSRHKCPLSVSDSREGAATAQAGVYSLEGRLMRAGNQQLYQHKRPPCTFPAVLTDSPGRRKKITQISVVKNLIVKENTAIIIFCRIFSDYSTVPKVIGGGWGPFKFQLTKDYVFISLGNVSLSLSRAGLHTRINSGRNR